MVFNQKWFQKHQRSILWLANTSLIKIWFRWILRIRKFDLPLSKKITEIAPNYFEWIVGYKEGKEYRARDFRMNDKFARRLYFAFRYAWLIFHAWDWLLADRFFPALSFGFATLTKYPEPGTTADGRVMRLSVDETWATIVAGNGTSNNSDFLFAGCTASTTTDQFLELLRGICNFDISSLGEFAVISAATLSLWGETNRTGLGSDWAVGIVESASASDSALANGDFQTMSSTDFATRISQASWSTGAYNVFTLNSTALTYLGTKKTGIAKLGCKLDWDIDVSFGGVWASSQDSGTRISSAAHTGTSQDPKLIITFIKEKSVSDTMSMVGTHYKTASKVFTDTFTLVGSVFKTGIKIILDTFNLSEVLVKVKTQIRTFTDTMIMVETVSKRAGKVISDTISMADSVVKCVIKIISDTFTLVGTHFKTATKKFTERFLLSETLLRYKNNFLIIWDKFSKNVSSWTKSSKNTSSWDKEQKS